MHKYFQVHDRAQVFVSCALEDDGGSPGYVGSIERWLNRALEIPNIKCSSNISLFILVTILCFITRYFHIFIFYNS